MGSHFIGSLGFFGARWRHDPPSPGDFAAQDAALLGMVEEVKPVIQLQVQTSVAWRWDIGLFTALFGQAPVTGIRLLVWLLHASAVALSLVAVLLAYLEASQQVFIAESGYLAATAVLCLGGAAMAFALAEKMSANTQGERWVNVERPTVVGQLRLVLLPAAALAAAAMP